MGANTRVANLLTDLIPVSKAHEQITVSSTKKDLAGSLTAGSLNGSTKYVWFQVNGAGMRITLNDDTTSPTSSLGVLYTDGSSGVMCADTFKKVYAIREASTDAVVEIVEMTY